MRSTTAAGSPDQRTICSTGPKAGGPHYLYRFCAEQTLTINTAAAGGNAALLAATA